MNLRFRPHHFLCALSFQGSGYSDSFVKNFTKISNDLKGIKGNEILIQVVFQADDICQPCPHRQDSLCKTQAKITALDQRHAKVLGLKNGDQLRWGQAKKLIKNRIDLSTFDIICQGCEWKEWGVCANALQELHQED